MRFYYKSIIVCLKSIKGKIFLLLMLFLFAVGVSVGVKMAVTDYIDNNKIKFKVAVITNDDNKEIDKFIDIIFKNKEIEDIFDAQIVAKNIGEEMLKKGEVLAIITIPKGFLESVLVGENYPLTITINETDTFESQVISSVAQSFSELLRDSQSGIYTTLSEMRQNGVNSDEYLLDVNLDFLKVALNLNDLIEYEEIRFVKQISLEQHYIICIFLYLAFMTTALFCREINAKNELDFLRHIDRASTKMYSYYFSKLTLLFAVYFVIFIAAVAFFGAEFTFGYVISLGNATLFFVLYSFVFYNIFGGIFSAVTANFILTTASLYLCGGIIPSVFIPEKIAYFEKFTPLFQVKNLVSASFEQSETVILDNLFLLVVNMILVVILAIILQKIVRRKVK